jgi:hypothetical protein
MPAANARVSPLRPSLAASYTAFKRDSVACTLRGVNGIEWNMCSPARLRVLLFYKKKNFVAKKIVRSPYVSAGPLPPALPIPLLALWVLPAGMPADRPAAIVPGRVPHAGASMAMHAGGHALGHLGHLGHGFKLHGHACRWVIWVIVF